MTCGYCQFSNLSEDHRCSRCGRRLDASTQYAMRSSGANALAPQEVAPKPQPASARRKEISMDTARTLDDLPRARVTGIQPSLFGTELQPKIIPFDSLPRTTTQEPLPASVPAPKQAAAKSNLRKSRAADDTQATLDFLQPAKVASKTLKTSAEAVIYCDAVAAAPMHRCAAAALDAAMVLAGFGIIVAMFEVMAHPIAWETNTLVMFGGMLLLTAMFYSLLFAIAGGLTPGLRWTELRLINFDGFPPDARSRAFRLAGGWISILSGGLGLIWALLDEEGLTWHDHMSKTFPTLRESSSIVVRHISR